MRFLTFAIVLILGACTASGGPDQPVISDDTPTPTSGAGLALLVVSDDHDGGGDAGMSVTRALSHRATDDLVLVTGALFVNADGTVLLCEAMAESFPPQCGGARLEVRGLELTTIEGLQREGDVQWAESVVLFGSVE